MEPTDALPWLIWVERKQTGEKKRKNERKSETKDQTEDKSSAIIANNQLE